MSDSMITIIVVTIVLLLMFFFPLAFVTAQNEKITQNEVKTITATFVNTIAKEGKITTNSYQEFIEKLNATGNRYYVELEAQICYKYPKDTLLDTYVIGENIYYSEFTSMIEEELKKNGEYELKKGDYIKVKVENRNITLSTQLKKTIYGIAGKDYSVIDANVSELVLATTQGDGLAKDPLYGRISLKDLKWNMDYYWTSGDMNFGVYRWVNDR